MAHGEHAFSRLSDHGERLRKDVVDGFSVVQAVSELVRHSSELFVRECRHFRLEIMDLKKAVVEFLQRLVVRVAEKRSYFF